MFLETILEKEGYHELRITRDVLPENLAAFKRELASFTGRSNLRLVLNFEHVDRFCSWALGVLAVTARQVRSLNGEVGVRHLSSNLRRIFHYARMDGAVTLIADETVLAA
ncbi:STAS domain-containing protein [bacterium]|nr:STAS domain-containing protein [bacterium]